MKRICLFAGYNYSNIVSEYVLDYLKELSKYADIYYMADGTLPDKELDKIQTITKGAWVKEHHGYDFYSWKLLADKYVGWEKIEKYDEVIFANDSCFCVNSFAPVFNKMDAKKELDIWGLSAADDMNVTETSNFNDYLKKNASNFYIGSYFWVVRKKFFDVPEFKKFINNIEIQKNRNDVYLKYELGIINMAQQNNAQLGVWDEMIWRYSTSYMQDAFNLLKNGYPLLKVRIFIDNIGGQTLMDDLAHATVDFCTVNYWKYIDQVRKERNIKVQKENNKKKKNKVKEIKRYILPPFILDIFNIRKIRKFFNFVNPYIKKTIKYICPPIIIDLFLFVFKYQGMKSKDKHTLSFIPRPQYGGYYPCHIKNYNKIQEQRIEILKDASQMVIFFNVMRVGVSGGMLSIDRFVEHSKPFAEKENFKVVQSNLPLTNACITNPFFDYSENPIDFNYIVKYTKPQKLMLNIPECFIPLFLNDISKEQFIWLWSIPTLCINILNQSNELMPDQHYIEELRTICNNKLTITAAHQRYCTEENSKRYNCPIYLLTPFLPDFYRLPIQNKEKIIVLSPDKNEYRERVVRKIKEELPDYKIITVKKMKLEEYKKLISKALFTITFGEGYDGYFIEPYLSDSIAFSIRNSNFFPKNFANIPTVYNSWVDLLQNITKDIRKYEKNPDLYIKISNECEKEISKFTNNNQSNQDLDEYYKRFLKK